ncbi:MAG: rRNA maturation RNase YbeY [Gammaproteobacteria bacterium]|nr:rRNA maturation RNase YbeY [Gammaproteobacteria bacterium]NKB65403.1 rRNA maturation RNase YbeY [Gammaproteobacteria bacterium]
MIDSFLDLQFATNDAINEKGLFPGEEQIENWIRNALIVVDEEVNGITLRIVEKEEMIELNHQFRHKNSVTNVLSFPFDQIDGVEYNHRGDIVICAQVVKDEAVAQGKSVDSHWAHLVVHGTLHLCGFDHLEELEAQEMEAIETQVMECLGYPDPYAQDGFNSLHFSN